MLTDVLLGEPIFLPILVAYIVSLIGKIITYSFDQKRLTFQRFWKDGGMPSSHTALVTGLTTAIFLEQGTGPLFWVTVILSLIVMHDAIGVRFQTGRQAAAINQMIELTFKGKTIKVGHVKEILGHTPTQVAVGALVGILSAWVTHTAFF